MRVVGFGDGYGLPQLQRHLPEGALVALVGAEIRPQYFGPLHELADSLGIPFLVQPQRASSNYPQFVAALAALKPDLIMVNSYSMKLHSEVLAIPRRGAVNVHGALLPEYRGSNPTQWALLNNERETGATMHYLDANFDTGDIIAQRRVPIYFEDTWRDIQARIGSAIEDLLAEELPRLWAGAGSRRPQDESRAHYYRRRHPEDGRIDWQDSVLKIYNLIRALVAPHPGAFYFKGPKKVVVDEYRTIPEVVRLKYGEAGRQELKAGKIALKTLEPSTFPGGLEGLKQSRQASEKPAGNQLIRFDPSLQGNDHICFGVQFLAADKIIGLCRLGNIDYTKNTAELGLQLMEGILSTSEIMSELINLLVKFAWEELSLQSIQLDISNQAPDALRIFQEHGFNEAGILRRPL